MAITQTIPLYSGVVPNRSQSPTDFRNNADDWLAYQAPLGGFFNNYAYQANLTALQINSDAADAAEASVNAIAASEVATSLANFKGQWSGLTGALSIPATVYHKGSYWNLLSNTANVALIEPSVSTQWAAVAVVGQNNYIAAIESKANYIADFVRNEFKIYESPYGQEPKQLTDIVTNTRASGATRNTQLGVETMGVDTLRIEYDGLTGEPLGALNEPAGVNLLFPSQDVTGYSLTRCTIAKSITVPNRYDDFACLFTLTETGAGYARKSAFTTQVGKYYCHSFEFKVAEAVASNLNVTISLNSSWITGGRTVTFDASSQTLVANSNGFPAFYGIDYLDDGWARIWGADLCDIAYTGTNSAILPWFSGNAGGTCHYSQVQINEGTYPLNPIVTTTSSVATVTDATRSQFLSRFLNDNFSFMVDVTPTGIGSDGTNRLIAFAASDAAVGDQIGVDIDTNGTRLRYRCANFTAVQSWTPPDPATLAGRLRIVGTVNKTTGDVKLWVNGTSVINTTTTNTANISAFRFVKYGAPTVAVGNMGKQIYHEAMVFPSALTDAESLALSAPVGV